MNKVCIGIISYLPEGENRIKRAEKLNKVLVQADKVLDSDIIIIAQNFHDVTFKEGLTKNKLIIKYYDKLGVVGARRELRKVFLESEYDYIILIDDDSIVYENSKGAGLEYVKMLNKHPNKWCEYKLHLLKLFAVSKEIFSKIDWPSNADPGGEPEVRIFEDMYLTESLKKFFGAQKLKKPSFDLKESSNSANDELSTWRNGEDFYNTYPRNFTGNITRRLVCLLDRKNRLTDQDYLNSMLEEASAQEKELWDSEEEHWMREYCKDKYGRVVITKKKPIQIKPVE